MILDAHADVTRDALAVMARTGDPRLREIMVALVAHLHAFVREVRLTEEEFRTATALLNEIGALKSDIHNEMVLMAGSLGVASLVCLLNNGDNGATETSQNLLGPFWRMNSPRVEHGGSIVRSDTPGPQMFVTLRVMDQECRAVAGAEVDIWHSSPVGLYEHQDEAQADMNLRGKFETDASGCVAFRTVKPAGYPIPTHGVVGRLLEAQGRHPYRPAHIHALVVQAGFKVLTSQIYADDDPRLHTDVQFGVTRALLGQFTRHDEPHPSEPDVGAPWYTLEHTLKLEAGPTRLPMAPIT